MAFFFNTLECAKDAMGSAWCTGTGYVVRRSALDQIGGFPVGSVAEDVLCSNMLIAGKSFRVPSCYVRAFSCVANMLWGSYNWLATLGPGCLRSSFRVCWAHPFSQRIYTAN